MGGETYGHPAVVRTPTGWLVVTRITSMNPSPLWFDHVTDAGLVTSEFMDVRVASDPSVPVTTDPAAPIVFVAWIGPSAEGDRQTPHWVTLVRGDLRQISKPQPVEGEFAALDATPSLALVENESHDRLRCPEGR